MSSMEDNAQNNLVRTSREFAVGTPTKRRQATDGSGTAAENGTVAQILDDAKVERDAMREQLKEFEETKKQLRKVGVRASNTGIKFV